MLILVAVSVNVIIKSNLIGTAEKAANGYKTAYERENQGNIEMLSEIASKATSEEEILELITVNITTPNEENIKLLWLKDGNVPEGYANVYSYIVEQSGNYTFKATNRRGRTSEITVPVETATFTLQLSETETKTFTFIEGDTWEGFIGNEGTITIDGVQFTRNSGSSIDIDCASLIKDSPSQSFILYMQDGNAVVQTDKIVTNGSYIVKRRELM